MSHASYQNASNWCRMWRNKVAIVADYQRLCIPRLPNVGRSYASRLKLGKHALNVRHRYPDNVVVRRTESPSLLAPKLVAHYRMTLRPLGTLEVRSESN